MKKIALLAIAAVSTIALANHILAVGSFGRGGARTSDGRVGTFDYEAVKRTAEGRSPKFAGRLRFEQVANDNGRRVLIEMGQPAFLAVTPERVCEFGGRGVLVTMIEGQRVTWRGRVSVRAHDRRNPEVNPTGDKDTFRIRFEDENNHTFSFEGLVDPGDLKVFSRREH